MVTCSSNFPHSDIKREPKTFLEDWCGKKNSTGLIHAADTLRPRLSKFDQYEAESDIMAALRNSVKAAAVVRQYPAGARSQ